MPTIAVGEAVAMSGIVQSVDSENAEVAVHVVGSGTVQNPLIENVEVPVNVLTVLSPIMVSHVLAKPDITAADIKAVLLQILTAIVLGVPIQDAVWPAILTFLSKEAEKEGGVWLDHVTFVSDAELADIEKIFHSDPDKLAHSRDLLHEALKGFVHTAITPKS